MAYDVSGLVDYIDELSASGDIWKSIVLSGDTAPTLAQFQTKYNELKLPILESDRDIFQDGDNCTFSASGNLDITQTSIDLCNLKVNQEFCPRDLEDKFTGIYLPSGQNYDSLPLGAMHIDRILQQCQAQNELLTWQGDIISGANSLALCDGFNFIVEDSSASTAGGDHTGVGAISNTTALGQVEALVDAAIANADTSAAVHNGMFIMYMGHDTFRDYNVNYRSDFAGGYIHADAMGTTMVQGTRVEMIPVAGLTGTDFMYLTPRNNFSTAMDLAADKGDVRVGLDEREELIWVKLRWKQGFGVRDFSQIFWHAPA